MTKTTTRTRWTHDTAGFLTAHLPDGREMTFSRPGGGYVYCDMGDPRLTGTLGRQICVGGGLQGRTISEASVEGFVAACKRWLRQYRQAAES